ncbi:MAG: AAA family ATPase [Roseibium sp.]
MSEALKEEEAGAFRFVDISASREIRKAIDVAREIPKYPVLISSKPGMGKSTALRHYARKLGAFYCEVGHADKTVKGMLKMIIEATGFGTSYRFVKDLSDTAVARLYEGYSSKRLLIVDEVQNLDLSAFRELLRIHEEAGCALVLSGNDKRLARTRIHDSALDQIVSRLGFRVELGSPLEEDCRDIAVDYNVEDTEAYKALAHFGRQTSVRDLVRLLVFAEKLKGQSGSINLHHLKAAFLTIYGNKRDLKLLIG